jgi:hypothetical protein
LNAKEEWGQEFAEVERVKLTAANKGAPQHRKSPCWRQDLAEEYAQKSQTFRFSEKVFIRLAQKPGPIFSSSNPKAVLR